MRYRKKPIVIEAVRWTGNNGEEIGAFCPTAVPKDPERLSLSIPTLEGDHEARLGDWIIRGIKGEFYPIKDQIFRLTYESAALPPTQDWGAPAVAARIIAFLEGDDSDAVHPQKAVFNVSGGYRVTVERALEDGRHRASAE